MHWSGARAHKRPTWGGFGSDALRPSLQFWLCLHEGKASSKKAQCAVTSGLWRHLGRQPLSLSPLERQAGTSQAASSLGGQTRPAAQSSAGLPCGAWEGERSWWWWRSAKRHRVRGGEASSAGSSPPPGHQGAPVLGSMAPVPLLTARPTLKHPCFPLYYCFYHLFARGGGKAVVRCSIQRGPRPRWALSL